MKSQAVYSNHDQNWQWPEKTWFRERLNALKAREHEQRRKSQASPRKSEQAQASSTTDNNELKVD